MQENTAHIQVTVGVTMAATFLAISVLGLRVPVRFVHCTVCVGAAVGRAANTIFVLRFGKKRRFF
jgi:hypothetical protein